jgi:hypothetical protein
MAQVVECGLTQQKQGPEFKPQYCQKYIYDNLYIFFHSLGRCSTAWATQPVNIFFTFLEKMKWKI